LLREFDDDRDFHSFPTRRSSDLAQRSQARAGRFPRTPPETATWPQARSQEGFLTDPPEVRRLPHHSRAAPRPGFPDRPPDREPGPSFFPNPKPEPYNLKPMNSSQDLLAVLTREGVLINASVRYPRFHKKLAPADLGLSPDQVSER